ncbi:MAG TPA: hypothetical protein VIJ66_13595, partial [Solirubrobacteraceae bacterium]
KGSYSQPNRRQGCRGEVSSRSSRAPLGCSGNDVRHHIDDSLDLDGDQHAAASEKLGPVEMGFW